MKSNKRLERWQKALNERKQRRASLAPPRPRESEYRPPLSNLPDQDRKSEAPIEAEVLADRPEPASSNPVPTTDKQTSAKGPLTLRQMKALNLEKPEEIVANILSEGETIALIARPKTGKTRLMQQLSVAVALGSEATFLGQQIQGPRRVFYLDFESRRADALDRFEKIAGKRWKDVKDNIKVYCVDNLSESEVGADEDGLNHLKDMVRAFKADLLLIDTWRLFLGGKEGSAKQVVKSLRELNQVRSDNPKLAIVIAHHPRKTQGTSRTSLIENAEAWLEQASGSYAFVAHTNAAFGLEHASDNSGHYVFNGARRGGEAHFLMLRSDEQSLRFEVVDELETKAALLTPAARKLWLKLPTEFRWRDAEKIAGGPSRGKSLLHSTLNQADKLGLLEHPGRGSYKKLVN